MLKLFLFFKDFRVEFIFAATTRKKKTKQKEKREKKIEKEELKQ